MLSYTMIGTNDLRAAEIFYNALLVPLGYEVERWESQLCYSLPGTEDRENGPGAFHVTTPYDGKPATVGNGTMVAFRTQIQDEVRDLHAEGVRHGGVNEGSPGFREAYSPNFFVGYLRDPDGNKVALFCTNPDEPVRPEK